jgi:hypothetical protein
MGVNSLSIFEFPNHEQVINRLDRILPYTSFEAIIQTAAKTAEQTIKQSLNSHNRTGETSDSVTTWTITKSDQVITLAVGSQTRGNILRWLDKGRGPVKPVNRKALRWLTHPDQVVVFAKYSRATKALNIMQPAAAAGLTQVEQTTTQLFTEQ